MPNKAKHLANVGVPLNHRLLTPNLRQDTPNYANICHTMPLRLKLPIRVKTGLLVLLFQFLLLNMNVWKSTCLLVLKHRMFDRQQKGQDIKLVYIQDYNL